MDWGPTNPTCAVWLGGEYAGTWFFQHGPHAAFKAWFNNPDKAAWMNDRCDDLDRSKFIPWCRAQGLAAPSTADLQYSTSLADHWWCGAEPPFALELALSAQRQAGPCAEEKLESRR